MSAHPSTNQVSAGSPAFKARIAGGFYLLCIVTSVIEMSGKGAQWLTMSSSLIATASFLAVTILFYYLFKPVSAWLSPVAMLFGLAGCAIRFLRPLGLAPSHVHSTVFFGFYLLLIGYLILRSTFLPHTLGALVAIAAGLGLLTFVSPRLANQLSPYTYVAAAVGEGTLTVWLLAAGVDAVRWKEQAGRQGVMPIVEK